MRGSVSGRARSPGTRQVSYLARSVFLLVFRLKRGDMGMDLAEVRKRLCPALRCGSACMETIEPISRRWQH